MVRRRLRLPGAAVLGEAGAGGDESEADCADGERHDELLGVFHLVTFREGAFVLRALSVPEYSTVVNPL